MKSSVACTVVVLISFIGQCHGQATDDPSFIVSVIKTTPGTDEESFLCYGTIITISHVLTTASCVSISTSSNVAIRTIRYQLVSGGFLSSSC